MKFIISSSTLLKQLTSVSGVIATNPLVPILENFLFEIEKEKLTITASDLQTTIITTINVESKESGNVCVPAKILLDTLRNLPEQPVTFSIDESSYVITIRSNNGNYKLSGENATDFPKVPAIKNASKVDVTSELLTKALANTIFATSTEDLRPAMTGVYFQLNETNLTFVSTDGHRLVRYRRVDVASDSASSIIVPRKALSLLKNSLPSENAPVTMEFNQSNAFFEFNSTKLICRLIDERYPEYENVIPLDNPNVLTINRLDLLNCLKRISIYANKTTHQVRLKMSGSELQVSAEDLDFSNEANERLVCEFLGEDMEIGFNAKFLLEMLSNLESETIAINMSVPSKAGLISPVESNKNEDILMLVMPVMLNSYA
ncbi:MAG: DNA polymerase III subunit beta [Bacteroidetes bacterium]|nr:MAG: DNA polymerase III subunit beta [Bacteroidota bacterium]